MVPPLPQLLAYAAREVVDEARPAALAVRRDEGAQLGVLLLRPLPLHLGDGVAAAAAAVGGGGGGLGVGPGGEEGVLFFSCVFGKICFLGGGSEFFPFHLLLFPCSLSLAKKMIMEINK